MSRKGVEPELWVPAERLLPVLGRFTGLVDGLSAGTQRKWWLLRAGGQQFVSLDAVDRMLIEMDLDVWLRLPPEDGGLADIYFDGKQYGSPDRTPHSVVDQDRVTVNCHGCGRPRSVLRRNLIRAKAQLCYSCGRRQRESRPGGRYELVMVACRGCGVERQVQAHYAAAARLRRCSRCANSQQPQQFRPNQTDSIAA